MNKILIVILIALTMLTSVLVYRLKEVNYRYKVSIENVKAYENERDSVNGQNREFKLTVQQLNTSKDSINQRLNEVRKELGIKDKKITQLQYQLSSVSKSDTIYTTDTIFKDPLFTLDTVVGDKWVSNHIVMKYPNVVISTPSILTENFVFIHNYKETINPPKKFFLLRWFQKKHIVVQVDVEEKNPYARKDVQRFIKVIK